MIRLVLSAIVCTMIGMTSVKASSVEDIKKRGVLNVGTEVSYEPYAYFQEGKIVGFDIDLANLLAAKLGVRVNIVDTAFSGILAALLLDKFDVAMNGIALTAERAQKVGFSNPYSAGGTVMLVRADGAVNSKNDLSGKVVASQVGSAANKQVKSTEEALIAAGKPGYKEIKLYDHYPEAWLDLGRGRLDAVFAGRPPAAQMKRKAPDKFTLIEIGERTLTGMLFRKEDNDLRAVANDLLNELRRDGRLQAMQKNWMGEELDIPETLPASFP